MSIEYRFDFGTGEPHEGYTKVGPQTRYDRATGYGFSRGEHIHAKRREGTEGLAADFCIPLDAVFRVDVPNGAYTVTLLIGDEIAATDTTVKAGQGKLMLHKQRTSPGRFAKKSFTVWVSEEKLTLAFGGLAPRVNAMDVAAAPNACTLFLAGDSTVTDQEESGYPYAGWGQMLPQFFKEGAAVANYALSGRSSKSFIREGHLDRIWSHMKPQDFLFIQFGHNDQKFGEDRHTEPFTTYKETLRLYIEGARQRGAVPVLITSVQRRFFEADGTLRDTHGDYLVAMRELAAEDGVPLIDLAEKSKTLFERLGPEGTKSIFMWLAPGEYMNFPEGTEDNTHFHELGAIEIARLALEGIRELGLQPLTLYLR